MRTELYLDTKDISQIVANYFNADLKNVSIFVQKEISGHGPMEHEVFIVKATIKQEGDLHNYRH